MLYHELDEGELKGIDLEPEGDFLRQFISLTDDEGEDGFIPFDQIIGIEVMKKTIFSERSRLISFIFYQQRVHQPRKNLTLLCTNL